MMEKFERSKKFTESRLAGPLVIAVSILLAGVMISSTIKECVPIIKTDSVGRLRVTTYVEGGYVGAKVDGEVDTHVRGYIETKERGLY